VTIEIDPVELTRDLIRCPSITPADAGALDVLQGALERLGFACHRLKFSVLTRLISTIYARIAATQPQLLLRRPH
jgi:succinyl-diaminopimelate desuccinylase